MVNTHIHIRHGNPNPFFLDPVKSNICHWHRYRNTDALVATCVRSPENQAGSFLSFDLANSTQDKGPKACVSCFYILSIQQWVRLVVVLQKFRVHTITTLRIQHVLSQIPFHLLKSLQILRIIYLCLPRFVFARNVYCCLRFNSSFVWFRLKIAWVVSIICFLATVIPWFKNNVCKGDALKVYIYL